jgi:hypothetical protein
MLRLEETARNKDGLKALTLITDYLSCYSKTAFSLQG